MSLESKSSEDFILCCGGKNQDLTKAPMYLVRSGNVSLPNRSLRNAGHNGNLWSSTVGTDSTHAYFLAFNNTTISPTYHDERIYGYPVRCIAE